MRAGLFNLFLSLAVLPLLTACASNPLVGYAERIPEATIQPVFVATQQTSEIQNRQFGTKRSRTMTYGLVNVSIPPSHRPGRIEWPRGEIDPSRHFAIIDQEPFASVEEFRSRIAEAPDGGSGVTILYVHGYNKTIPKATYRLAQLMTDFEESAPAVLFGWPSAGDPRAYLYDRDSVLFARDDLVDLLDDLTAKTDRKIAIVAHSMGAHLTMEALRQIALSGDRTLLSKVVWVALVSPDIDPDVFRRQAETIGELPEEFYIVIARQDRALQLSSFLTGGRRRIGLIEAPEDVTGLDVTVLDLSNLADGRFGDHSVGFNSPSAIEALARPTDWEGQQDGAPEFIVFPRGP